MQALIDQGEPESGLDRALVRLDIHTTKNSRDRPLSPPEWVQGSEKIATESVESRCVRKDVGEKIRQETLLLSEGISH